MTAGVGLFIGIIGLQNGGIIADHPATLSPWVTSVKYLQRSPR